METKPSNGCQILRSACPSIPKAVMQYAKPLSNDSRGLPRTRTCLLPKLVSATLIAFYAWALCSDTWGQGFGGGGGFGGGNRRSSASGNYATSTSVGQATFMSDPETRKVIAVTDAETAKYISQIITNLDRPAPQVLIKVVFVEATYNKNLDLGIEGTY